jgi:hypothetical protein
MSSKKAISGLESYSAELQGCLETTFPSGHHKLLLGINPKATSRAR